MAYPPSLGAVSDRFKTPSTSITLTGVVLLLLIAFVPIADIAKLASAFQILVFVLVNVAVVAFRRGTAEYESEFHAPFYPWVQAVGVVGGLVLLTQMGTVPLLGAVCITAGGVAWYYVYARDRVDREGAAVDAAAHDATIRLEYAVEEFASEGQRRALADYHEEIAALCSVPVRTGFVRSDGGTLAIGTDAQGETERRGEDGAVDANADADALVVGTDGRSLAADADRPVLVVRPREETTPGWLGRLLERRLF